MKQLPNTKVKIRSLVLLYVFSVHPFICMYIIIMFIAANMDRSNLYLKLFKLVFGSVSLFAAENEQMLKVYNLDIFYTKRLKLCYQ